MAIYLSNRDGDGKTNEEGHYKFHSSIYSGNVVASGDLSVVQSSPISMSVLVQTGQFKIDTSGGYSYTGWIDSPATVTIPTADPANPRVSSIVLYVDRGAPTSASPPNNPGIAKLAVVNGTPATNPTAPNSTTITNQIGSNNPYTVIATVRAGAGATQITNSNITDTRTKMTLGEGFVKTSSIQDSAVTGSKLASSSVNASKMVSGTALLVNEIAMFNARKTSNQTAVSNNAETLISWNEDVEYMNATNFTSSTFTAPRNGWLNTQCRLVIDNGTDTDDSMEWGFYVNNVQTMTTIDNWREFSTASGIEYNTTMTANLKLNAGDTVTVKYFGTAYAVLIRGNAGCIWSGMFIPEF